jgi:glycosyltransferase involved in cell wall biosynthesis
MKNSKKIVFVGGNLYPYKVGGYEIFNYYLLQELRKCDGVRQISHFKRPNYIMKEEYVQITDIKPSIIFNTLQYFLKIIKNYKNDILVLTFAKSHWLNWWIYPILNVLFGVKYIIIIHGGGLSKWKWDYPFMMFFKRAAYIIGISDRICREYNKRTNLQLKFIPPLIPFVNYENKEKARELWEINKNSIVCLVVGSIKSLKKPDTIIAAAKELGETYLKNNNVLFIFAGDGNMKAVIQEEVNSSSLQEYFRFLGNVDREKVTSLYALADIYIMASEFEGTPLSLLEAMYNKINIIASNAPGINTIVEDNINGHIFEIGNSKQLACKINLLISNLENKSWRNEANKTYNERFDYKKMIINYKKILENL